MFPYLGRVVCRLWWVFLILWPLATLWLRLTSPTISQVASDDTATYLPEYAESVVGRRILTETFPSDTFPSTAVIIIAGRYGPLSEDDYRYVDRLTAALSAKEGVIPDRPHTIVGVLSVSNHPELKPIYTSKDGRATLIRVGLDVVWISGQARAATAWIRRAAEGAPPHLDVRVTGDAALGADYTQGINESLHRTTIAAIVLVVIILLLIYRSPVAPLVPLAGISMGYLASNALIARAVGVLDYKVPSMAQMFLVVIVFGAGTDYCLFLIARFKEHLIQGLSPAEAARRTVASVGAAVSASAATVIVGLSLLYFIEFKEFAHIGPAVAFGLLVMLIIALTFAPALMLLMGKHIFWPASVGLTAEPAQNSLWAWLGRNIRRRPATMLIAMLLVFLPLFAIGWRMRPSYDIIGQLRPNLPSVAGFDLLKRHYAQGEMLPVTLVIQSEKNLRESQYLDAQSSLARVLRRNPQVQGLRCAVEPYGGLKEFEPARLAAQARLLVAGTGSGLSGTDEILNGVDAMKAGLGKALQYVRKNQQEVAERAKGGMLLFIPVPGPSEFKAAAEGLAALAAGLEDLRAGLDRMESGLKSMRAGWVAVRQRLAPLADEDGPFAYIARRIFLLPEDVRQNPALSKAFDNYISADGRLARLSLIFKDPPHSLPATQAVEDMGRRMPDILAGAGIPATRSLFAGATPNIKDVRLITQRDYYLMMVLVVAGVFVVLFVQFRRLAPILCMLGTVLLSYVATMGIVLLVFNAGLGAEVDWKVRFFMFVIMVALGEDYNIYIMSRIEEEGRQHGLLAGVERAVVRTGNIISSCGIILAGTFSAMMASTLPIVVQIGFGIACGMLVDTFLVRPVLLPSLIVLLAPYRLTRAQDTDLPRP